MSENLKKEAWPPTWFLNGVNGSVVGVLKLIKSWSSSSSSSNSSWGLRGERTDLDLPGFLYNWWLLLWLLLIVVVARTFCISGLWVSLLNGGETMDLEDPTRTSRCVPDGIPIAFGNAFNSNLESEEFNLFCSISSWVVLSCSGVIDVCNSRDGEFTSVILYKAEVSDDNELECGSSYIVKIKI